MKANALSQKIKQLYKHNKSDRTLKKLKRLGKTDHVVLSAPAAVAQALLHSGNTINKPIKVLVAEPSSKIEILDDGQWYRYIPKFLSSHSPVEVYFVGTAIPESRDSDAQKCLQFADNLTVRIIKGDPETFINESGIHFDVCTTFQTHLSEDKSKVLSKVVHSLIERTIPVYLISHTTINTVTYSLMLQANEPSIGISEVIPTNSGIFESDPGVSWGSVMVRLNRDLAKIANPLESAKTLISMYHNSCENGFSRQPHPLGKPVSINGKTYIHVMDAVYLDEKNQLHKLTKAGLEGPVLSNLTIPEHRSTFTQLERVSWAANVKQLILNSEEQEYAFC